MVSGILNQEIIEINKKENEKKAKREISENKKKKQ